MDQNVIVVSFPDDAKAYQALSEIKALAVKDKLQLVNAAVVHRDHEGLVHLKDGATDGQVASGPLTGTLVGALVGMLAGPLGVLLGSVSGALIGSAVAVDDASDRASVLDQMMQSIPNGATSLIATVGEYAPEVINGLITNLGGSVLRRPLAVVKAEVDAHSEAQAAAAKEARRVLRTKQGDEWHDKFDNWKEELGESFDKLKNKLEQAFSSKK